MPQIEVEPSAKPIKIHPANVAKLGGNIAAAYVMSFLIQHCHDEEKGRTTMREITYGEFERNLGMSRSRVRTALDALHDLKLILRERIEVEPDDEHTFPTSRLAYEPNVKIVEP